MPVENTHTLFQLKNSTVSKPFIYFQCSAVSYGSILSQNKNVGRCVPLDHFHISAGIQSPGKLFPSIMLREAPGCKKGITSG